LKRCFGSQGIDLYYTQHFDNLPPVTKEDIFQKAKTLISISFGQNQEDPDFDEDTTKFLKNGELYVLYKDGKVIGIKLVQILSFESSRILYLAGTAIDPEWQGRGLNSQLTSSLIQSHNIDVMVARTQNPNNYKMLQRFCGTVWPQGDSKPPQFIQKIGLHMADRLGRTSGTFNPQTLVDKDTYGSAIYETIPHPQSSSPEINALFANLLNFADGDSLLTIGEVNKPSADLRPRMGRF